MGLSLGGLPKTAGELADIDTEVGMLMSEFDSNNDGSVSREEFRSSLERCRLLLKVCNHEECPADVRV